MKNNRLMIRTGGALTAFLLFVCVFSAGMAENTAGSAVSGQGESVIEPISDSPDYVTALLDVARGELGYTEGKNGRTKYGEWVGDPTCQWCAEFLCWCVDQTDRKWGYSLLENIYPMYGTQNVGRNWFIRQGRYIARNGFVPEWGSQWYHGEEEMMEKNSYIPQPGDWVFFASTETGDTTHVAMVEYCTRSENDEVSVHVIEGNMPDKVQRNAYSLTDANIQGYGTVYDLADWSMHFGNKGEKVKQLQRMLSKLGYMEERFITGSYGDITQNAVMSFQRQHGIEQTGNAGPITQRALNRLILDRFGAEDWEVLE